jgi:RNA-binding protein
MALNPAQRKFLRSTAHHLEPLVIIGKQGLTDALVKAAGDVLEAHELIKIRFNDFKNEKQDIADKVAFRTGSDVVGIIGHVAILYRHQSDDEKRKIEVPEA